MTTLEIGNQLVALCSQGKNAEAIATLYSPEIVSVEAFAPDGGPTEMRGLEAIKAKSVWWHENHVVHSVQALGPFSNGDKFAVFFKMDVTNKKLGKRFTMDEVAMYSVHKGKIAREEFYYKTM